MISLSDVQEIHKRLIDTFGGAHGIRDMNALESALARPFHTFNNIRLYPGVIEQAASLVESILINHPFIDGNKRTGYVLLRLLLVSNGIDFTATGQERYDLIIDIASGKLKFESITDWLTRHTSPVD